MESNQRSALVVALAIAWAQPVGAQVFVLEPEECIRTDNDRIQPRVERMVDGPYVIEKDRFRTLQPGRYVEDTVYVRFAPWVDLAEVEVAHQLAGGATVEWESRIVPRLYRVRTGALDVFQTIQRYLARESTLYAEPDYLMDTTEVPNDPYPLS